MKRTPDFGFTFFAGTMNAAKFALTGCRAALNPSLSTTGGAGIGGISRQSTRPVVGQVDGPFSKAFKGARPLLAACSRRFFRSGQSLD